MRALPKNDVESELSGLGAALKRLCLASHLAYAVWP